MKRREEEEVFFVEIILYCTVCTQSTSTSTTRHPPQPREDYCTYCTEWRTDITSSKKDMGSLFYLLKLIKCLKKISEVRDSKKIFAAGLIRLIRFDFSIRFDWIRFCSFAKNDRKVQKRGTRLKLHPQKQL